MSIPLEEPTRGYESCRDKARSSRTAPRYVAFEINLAQQRSRVKAGDVLELEMEPIKNPVTAAEVTPGAVLPEGFITKDPKFAASKLYRVRDGVHYDHSGSTLPSDRSSTPAVTLGISVAGLGADSAATAFRRVM